MATPPPIRISGLVKTYGPTRALDGLDLTVGAGEVHGLLGPNGAGKTTTIRILLGLLRPLGHRRCWPTSAPWGPSPSTGHRQRSAGGCEP